MNVVTRMKFTATMPVFSTGRNGSYLKDVTVSGTVTKGAVYSSDLKHWIYFEVTATDDNQYYELGKQYKKQGKNFYPAVTSYEYPANYELLAETKNKIKEAHFSCNSK